MSERIKQLGTTFKKRGFLFAEVIRSEDGTIRVYDQMERKTGDMRAHVVARIKLSTPPPAWESDYDKHETFPSDNQWGQMGWTFTRRGEALAKFKELCSKQIKHKEDQQ